MKIVAFSMISIAPANFICVTFNQLTLRGILNTEVVLEW